MLSSLHTDGAGMLIVQPMTFIVIVIVIVYRFFFAVIVSICNAIVFNNSPGVNNTWAASRTSTYEVGALRPILGKMVRQRSISPPNCTPDPHPPPLRLLYFYRY